MKHFARNLVTIAGAWILAVSASADPVDVSADLARFTESGKIPGMAVAAVRDGKVVAYGVSGVRKHGDTAKVTLSDKFHIGSCTKSMTGTLAAMLVRDGKIKWESTVAEVFPDLEISPGYRKATLLQMLSNSGGGPGDMPKELWENAVANREKPEAEQRQALIRALLSIAPAYPPGTKRVYSNGGFTIAGAMLEEATGKPYDGLLRDRLFKPLGMSSGGFGMPASPGKTDQPWGHVAGKDDAIIPIPPGPDSDNPPAITPAGRVHLSILDFAKYARFHLGDSPASPLDADSIRFLHTPTPPGEDYALGWVPLERPWGGKVLMHNGTNTMNYSVIWMSPEKKLAVMALCNSGHPSAAETCDAAVAMLIKRFGK